MTFKNDLGFLTMVRIAFDFSSFYEIRLFGSTEDFFDQS